SSDYAARFGPDPGLVQPAIAALSVAGLHAVWVPPSSLIAADGPAPAAAHLFQVDIESYRLPNGSQFYASLDQPHLPPDIAAIAASVSGLDNYRRSRGYAVRPGGLVPTDILTYYNVKPLRDAGIDGKGQTVLLPEIDDLPNLNDLNKFASKFGLPSFDSVLPSSATPAGERLKNRRGKRSSTSRSFMRSRPRPSWWFISRRLTSGTARELSTRWSPTTSVRSSPRAWAPASPTLRVARAMCTRPSKTAPA